jgi:hypothetical protein
LGDYSKTYPASGMIFRDAEPGLTFDWHNAPQPQYIIYLEGEVEIDQSLLPLQKSKNNVQAFSLLSQLSHSRQYYNKQT